MSAHILVFDSGIGGTTVLDHIVQSIPNAQYSYFMDNALLPYGAQTQQTIIKRLTALVKFIEAQQLNVDLIVIACNTASTSALSALRKVTQIPIVGVVPAIKPAAQLTQTKHIGLLATPTTTASEYTKQLIHSHAANVQVSLYSSVALVSIAEEFYFTKKLNTGLLHQELDKLAISDSIDVLVLGCTHFPILAEAIKNYFNSAITLLDSGQAIANRVHYILTLNNQDIDNLATIKKPLHFYATASINNSYSVISTITQIDLTQYELH